MTRQSRREIERVIRELENERSGCVGVYDSDPLTPAEKRKLADRLDVGPWGRQGEAHE
jgi:hypothetical protein